MEIGLNGAPHLHAPARHVDTTDLKGWDCLLHNPLSLEEANPSE